jgi:hypothetical protein
LNAIIITLQCTFYITPISDIVCVGYRFYLLQKETGCDKRGAAGNLQPLARVIDSINDTYASTETIANAIMEEIARAEKGGAVVELVSIFPITQCPEYSIPTGPSAPVEPSTEAPLVMFVICVSGV